MKKRIYILSALVLTLSLWAAALWLHHDRRSDIASETRYGVGEGMELVEQTTTHGDKRYVVEDADGNTLFRIPLRGCLLDTRFRDGRLCFREMATGREGYVDTHGMVAFTTAPSAKARAALTVPEDQVKTLDATQPDATAATTATTPSASDAPRRGAASTATATASAATFYPTAHGNGSSVRLSQTDIRKMAQSSPFYSEAAKILQGRLSVSDAACRRQILNYCEHLRTAYTSKDIDFLRQVFSDNALIIVGNVVKTSNATGKVAADSRVTYALHSKRDYLTRLAAVFAANKQVDVRFSDFHIMRHPTRDAIYGVSLHQRYRSDRYADDGYLFLLWDFRNAAMPLIHVRTWQPAATVDGANGVIDISDFNLE